MHTSRRRVGRAGLTLIEVVVVVLLVALLASMLLPALLRQREEARRIRCRNNLNDLAKGMAVYLSEYGDNTWFPCPLGRGQTANDYNGAEWLASLYWTGVIPDPDVFLCPASEDSNDNGRDIGRFRAAPTFGSQTVSYAGLHYYSLRDKEGKPIPGAIAQDYPPNMPMACDATQGSLPHAMTTSGGLAVLFFDSHVEFRTSTEMNMRTCVGSTEFGGLLQHLRN